MLEEEENKMEGTSYNVRRRGE